MKITASTIMISVNCSGLIYTISPESQHLCPHDVGYSWIMPNGSKLENTFAVTCADDEQGK